MIENFRDPLDLTEIRRVKKYINSKKIYFNRDLKSVFGKYSHNRKVLDLGCVEHTEEAINSINWKHAIIFEKSSYCLGTDISIKGVEILNNLNFNVRVSDATSDEFLGDTFDLIIAGDIIEHVDNLGGLMLYLKRHLAQNGSVLISTPNPYFVKNWVGGIRGDMEINLEHCTWLTEFNMFEISRRYNFKISQIGYTQGRTKSRSIHFLKWLFFKLGFTFLFPNVIYILKEG